MRLLHLLQWFAMACQALILHCGWVVKFQCSRRVCVCVRVRACSFCVHACVLCVCVCVHRARLHPDLQQSAAADCTGAGGVQGKLDIPIGLGQATLVLNTAFPRI